MCFPCKFFTDFFSVCRIPFPNPFRKDRDSPAPAPATVSVGQTTVSLAATVTAITATKTDATFSTGTLTPAAPTSTITQDESSGSTGINAAKIGYIVGGIAGVLILMALISCLYYKSREDDDNVGATISLQPSKKDSFIASAPAPAPVEKNRYDSWLVGQHPQVASHQNVPVNNPLVAQNVPYEYTQPIANGYYVQPSQVNEAYMPPSQPYFRNASYDANSYAQNPGYQVDYYNNLPVSRSSPAYTAAAPPRLAAIPQSSLEDGIFSSNGIAQVTSRSSVAVAVAAASPPPLPPKEDHQQLSGVGTSESSTSNIQAPATQMDDQLAQQYVQTPRT